MSTFKFAISPNDTKFYTSSAKDLEEFKEEIKEYLSDVDDFDDYQLYFYKSDDEGGEKKKVEIKETKSFNKFKKKKKNILYYKRKNSSSGVDPEKVKNAEILSKFKSRLKGKVMSKLFRQFFFVVLEVKKARLERFREVAKVFYQKLVSGEKSLLVKNIFVKHNPFQQVKNLENEINNLLKFYEKFENKYKKLESVPIEKKENKYIHSGTNCNNCEKEIRGNRYVCASCDLKSGSQDYNLCKTCKKKLLKAYINEEDDDKFHEHSSFYKIESTDEFLEEKSLCKYIKVESKFEVSCVKGTEKVEIMIPFETNLKREELGLDFTIKKSSKLKDGDILREKSDSSYMLTIENLKDLKAGKYSLTGNFIYKKDKNDKTKIKDFKVVLTITE